jgi:virginiamycin B lyase
MGWSESTSSGVHRLPRPRHVTLLLVAIAALMCVVASRADAFVYWADSDGDRIGRANNDGTGVNRGFIPVSGNPNGVAVDDNHIYWGNAETDAIGRAKLDGSAVDQSFIAGAAPVDASPLGVAVDGANIWWSNFSFSVPGSIGRADLDGTGAQPSFISGGSVANPCGVALRAGLLYWANPGLDPEGIARAGAPPPPSPDSSFVDNAGTFPCWPAVSGSHIYWALIQGGILRADISDGTNITGVTQANGVGGIAILGSKLYFANNTEGTISRANLDGSTPEFALVTGAGAPAGLAVDSGSAPPNGGGGGCDLTLGNAKKNKKKGTAKLSAEVGCAGALELGGKGLKPAERQASGAGEVNLPVKAKGNKKKKLRKKGKAKVKPEVTFTPNGGAAVTEDKKVKLIKK